MKKQKVLVPFLFILVFFIVFLGCSVLWKDGWWHSKAEDEDTTTTSTDIGVLDPNESGQTLISFDTTFYNYRYDNELSANNATRNQGKESCYDGGVIPFGEFDSALSEYYKENGVNVGIYTGNFYNYYGGLPGVGANKKTFPGYYNFRWAANIANRTSPYDSVCQGIVENELADFNISKNNFGTLMTATTKSDGTTGKVKVPYFDKGFLTEDNKVNGVAIGAVKEGVKFPFRKITSGSKSGYYEFDSTKDVIKFDGMETGKPSSDTYYYGKEGKLQYYYNKENVTCKSSSSAQFFPFNKKTDGQSNIDYGFGVRFDIPFFLSEDGKLNGKNMVFEFSGDDDVWIFLDGKLIMDLGGQHGKSTGTIDFGVAGGAKATVSSVTRVKDSESAKETAMSDAILAEDTYIEHNVQSDLVKVTKGDQTKHVITIFYMERGMFESNFHMAFNFVPEGQPMPTPTPEPQPNTNSVDGGSLMIQNKMVFPTTEDDKSKINDEFIETVKDLAEDDVFQYSIQNQGTTAEQVGDSEIKYPSCVLTVRENGSSEFGKEKSYLSMGASSKVRIYVDIGAIEERFQELVSDKNFSFSGLYSNNDGDLKSYKEAGNYALNYLKISNATEDSILRCWDKTNKIYYFDMLTSKTSFSIEISVNFKNYENGQVIKIGSYSVQCGEGENWSNYDGKIYKIASISYRGYNDYKVNKVELLDSLTGVTLEKLGGGGADDKDYSSGLPYDKVGKSKNFLPTGSSIFKPVASTSYKLFESHKAEADGTKIKINGDTTSGVTDTNGRFGLFYDDCATFIKQFATGSQMKVVQENDLMKPKRSTLEESSITENTEVAKLLTTFYTPEPVDGNSTARQASDYYYTKRETISKDKDATTSVPIDVTYDGEFNYSNGTGISESDPVNIIQTYTNTIKTGSLTISKEIKGNMDVDSNYSYGFKVTFSDVFGGGSGEDVYDGSYTHTYEVTTTDDEGNETTETKTGPGTATNGIIILKPNETATISGIPVGTSYTIQEVTSAGKTVNDGSVVSKIVTNYVAELDGEQIASPTYETGDDENDQITLDKENRKISGVIPCSIINKLYGTKTSEFTEVNVTVAFTNQFGALTITKKVAGDVNNAAYYTETSTDGTKKEKEYTFTVKDGTTPYRGNYWVYTYKFVAANLPLAVKSKDKCYTDNGTITLQEGQVAEIGGIDLAAGNLQYTITENIDSDDIYFVESLKVTSGTADGTVVTAKKGNIISDNTTHNASITSGKFSSSQPTFDVIFTNRYSNAYIEIDKFIDKLYCGDKKYADYTDESKKDITYQELTGAKQSFIFKVKQYKTLADAEADTNSEGSFNVVLNFGDDDNTEVLSSAITFASKDYNYRDSKQVKVLANRYYRIEEDTNWSWKYTLEGVDCQDSSDSSIANRSTKSGTVVYLKTYLDALNNIDDGDGKRKVVPIAEFYNALDTTKEDIEGDTDSIPNKIKTE